MPKAGAEAGAADLDSFVKSQEGSFMQHSGLGGND